MTINVLDPKYIEEFARQQSRPLAKGIDYIPTPFPSWNRCCRDDGGGEGLAMGWHIVLAGGTGKGKSLLALNMAASAIRVGSTVGFVSLEMGKKQLSSRLYGILTDSPVGWFERGQRFNADAVMQMAEFAAERDMKAPKLLMDDEAYSLTDILAAMNDMVDQGATVLIVDYLQIAKVPGLSRFEQVTEVSSEMRRFAKRMSVLTFGLSQFNRDTSKNEPTIHGLSGAGGLEQDCDQAVLIDHSRYEELDAGAQTYLLLGKNRHGRTGEIPAFVDYKTLRFREAMPDEEGSWPT